MNKELIQLEFLGLTNLIELEEGKETIQMFWDNPEKIDKELLKKGIHDPMTNYISSLVEFRDSKRIVNLGYIKVRVFSLFKIY